MKKQFLVVLFSFSFSAMAFESKDLRCNLGFLNEKSHKFEIKVNHVNNISSVLSSKIYHTRIIHNQSFLQVEITNHKEEVLGFMRIDETISLDQSLQIATQVNSKLLVLSCK